MDFTNWNRNLDEAPSDTGESFIVLLRNTSVAIAEKVDDVWLEGQTAEEFELYPVIAFARVLNHEPRG